MSISTPAMRWWGWGVDQDATSLSERAIKELHSRFDLDGTMHSPVALEDIPLEKNRIRKNLMEQFAGIAGGKYVSDNPAHRIGRRAGKSYPDLMQLRLGLGTLTPDAVIQPQTSQHVQQILELCQREQIAVIPFGGGTSVVSGLDAQLGACHAAISLDLRSLDRVLEVDPISRLVTVEGGIRCFELEQALLPYGLTLGHFPQSFEYVSVGGCVATRSAGQNSTGYGRIDELVSGLKLIGPAQQITCHPMVKRAAGPELRDLIIGSEGIFGVITEVTLQVTERPKHQSYCAYMVDSFQAGQQLCRDLAGLTSPPSLVRLSDETETEMTLLLSGSEGIQQHMMDGYLRLRHVHNGCLLMLGWEGSELAVQQQKKQTALALKRYGAVRLGTKVGDAWKKHRFSGPYLRDELLNQGVFVETLETATVWRNLPRLYGAVKRALQDSLRTDGIEPIIMCHISHLYETGASLYFTFLTRQSTGRETISQWQAAKSAACEAIIKNNGTISHHHAIGKDHAHWLSQEVGDAAILALQSLKSVFDPAGIMNPGKVLEANQ